MARTLTDSQKRRLKAQLGKNPSPARKQEMANLWGVDDFVIAYVLTTAFDSGSSSSSSYGSSPSLSSSYSDSDSSSSDGGSSGC